MQTEFAQDSRMSNDLSRTRKRSITRRGVLWLGQTCNLRCHFCYFLDRIENKAHPEHAFMSIEKSKQICSMLVDYYENNAIDIQGGEPTLYKHIYELVRHCREISLLPTLITNAVPLFKRENVRKLKEAGIRDLLVSIQGICETYDRIVGMPGAFAKQMQGLDNIIEEGIPIRFNCVLSKPVLPQLGEVADLAISKGARVVNFLAFNPFEDQQLQGKRNTVNVPRYSEVALVLDEAIDKLEAAGIEVNVRYFPICMVAPRHYKNIYNFQQLPFDTHEWDYASWSWTGMQPQRMGFGSVSPLTDLKSSTYRPASYPGPLKHVANGVRRVVHKYPGLRGTAETINRAYSQLVNPGPTA
ncbi:MAG: radical SAM protein, partial [Methylococcales bacterium]